MRPSSARASDDPPIEVVALVASLGGLDALTKVLRALPPDLPAAVVVSQHLGGQGSRLVEILRRRTALPVDWAQEGRAIKAGHVLVAPPRSVMEVLPDGTCSVRRGALISERPLDLLLRSLADSHGSRALGVVLTGMGTDGAAGTAALTAVGATVIAQSEDSAEHPDMPRAAAQAGAQVVLELDQIGSVVADVVRGGPFPPPADEVESIERLFSGPGETRALLRDTDWSKTPLGPVSAWPEALRVTARLMLDSAQPMSIWWGPQLILLYNDAYVDFLSEGKHPDALGRPLKEVWGEVWDQITPMVDTVLSGEPVAVEEWRGLIERDGVLEEVFNWFSYSPIVDAGGATVGVFAAAWITTAKAVAERRLRVLREVTVATQDAPTTTAAAERAVAALATDPDDLPFALLYRVDEPMRQALLVAAAGAEEGSFAAPRVIWLTGDADPWPVDRVCREGEPLFLDDLRARLPGLTAPAGALAGTQPPSSACLKPIPGRAKDKTGGVLVLGISPHRPLDEEHRDFLELVRTQVEAAIEQASKREQERERLRRLADLDKAKTEFFSNVSHEFRTPLTLMLAPLEERLRDGEGLTPELREDLELIRRNAHRLLRLVGTMLDFSQIEAGRLRAHFEPTDLAALTRDVVAQFDSAAAGAGIGLHVDLQDLGQRVWVDPEMWEKVVSNLLSNALKFTFEGTIDVTLRALPKHAELVVRDTGVGIPEEERPFVFKRFHRVRGTRARTEEGAGIGLALVDELVRRHHGRIRVTSEVGEGTAFTVWVPLGRRAEVEDRPPAAPRSQHRMAAAMAEEASRWTVERTDSTPQSVSDDTPLHQSLRAYAPGARVLVADDNADMRDYLARLLGEHWEVLVARDGREALEVARAQRPDLVVADVMMPELDGFGLVAQLREDPALAAIPTVLVTARAGEEAAIEGLLAGADDYIVKPFSARELLARVGGQLELARARRRTAELNAFLVRFSDAVRGLDDPAEVARTACRMILGQLGGIRSYWSEIDFEAGEWVTVGEAAAPGAQAITGRYPLEAWQSGTTQLLLEGGASVKDDIQADAGLPVSVKELCAGLDMAANLALPVQVDGRTRCVLAVDDREPRRWSADEVALVQAVAVRCWGEVERARAEAALRASEQRHAFLLKLSDTLRSLTDAAEIKHTAAALLGERLRVDRAFWSEMVGDDWVIDDVFETNGAPLPPGRYPAGVYGRWTMDTLRAGLPVAIGDTAGDARLHPSERAALQGIGVVAVIGVPLLREGEVVATLSVHSHEPRAWTDEELELVQETADRTWPAVERTRAEASLRYQLAVANTPGVGVLTWETATGTLLDANEVFFQLSGYERELMAAGEITWRLLTADEDVAESERQLDRLARTGHIGPYRKDLVRADGSRVPMLYAGAAIGEGIAVEYCIDVRHGGLADALLVDLAREPR